jgi:hypothetical protein
MRKLRRRSDPSQYRQTQRETRDRVLEHLSLSQATALLIWSDSDWRTPGSSSPGRPLATGQHGSVLLASALRGDLSQG